MPDRKYCTSCGANIAYEAKFCNHCGQPAITPPPAQTYNEQPQQVQQQPQQVYQQPQQVQQQPQQQNQYAYQPQQRLQNPPKRKGKGCLIAILVVFAALILFMAIPFLMPEPDPAHEFNVGNNTDNGSTDNSGTSTNNNIDNNGTSSNTDNSSGMVDPSLPEYTFMVYMNGSDLESEYYWEEDAYGSAATDDIIEMAYVGSNENLNIIIETGGTSFWNNNIIDPNQNQRYLVNKDELFHLQDLGAKNMGSPDTLYDFIVWTVTNYPAQKYVLDFWNHGGGPLYGFGSDELFSVAMDGYELQESLTLDEIENALRRAKETTGVQFEVIGFDACLMASVEVAHMVSPYANYLVASEELEPAHGWNYEGLLNGLMTNPSMNGAELGMIISDSFYEQALLYETEEMITLSVIDLSLIGNVVAALENLSIDMMTDMGEVATINMIAGSRNRAESYGSNTPFSGYTELIDLYDFSSFLLGNQLEEATALQSAIEAAVVYQVKGPSRLYGGGLSVYFPYMEQENRQAALNDYSAINEIDIYENFLQSFISTLDADTEGTVLKSRSLQEEEDGSYTVVIAEEDRENVLAIYNFVGIALDENLDYVLSLGFDTDVFYNEETGEVKDNFIGWWTGINDHLVTLDIIEQTDTYNLYSVPAIVNGIEMEIIGKWYWDESYVEGGYYEILGGWELADEYSLMSEKNFIELKAGDKVQFQFYVIDMVYGDDYIFDMDEVILDQDPYMGFVELPVGESYIYGFYFEDYALNGTFSEFTIFELVE